MKQQLQKRSSRLSVGVYLAAPFVAFYRALKGYPMSIEDISSETDLAVYFDFKNQVFIVEPKTKKLLTAPELLFYSGSKDAVKNFFEKFKIAFNNRKSNKIDSDFFIPLLKTDTTYNSKPLLF